jgi:hypothetical protein
MRKRNLIVLKRKRKDILYRTRADPITKSSGLEEMTMEFAPLA